MTGTRGRSCRLDLAHLTLVHGDKSVVTRRNVFYPKWK